jgi:hypothetical protein
MHTFIFTPFLLLYTRICILNTPFSFFLMHAFALKQRSIFFFIYIYICKEKHACKRVKIKTTLDLKPIKLNPTIMIENEKEAILLN